MKAFNQFIIASLTCLFLLLFATPNQSQASYSSYVYDLRELRIFSYGDNNQINIYDTSGVLQWDNNATPINFGSHRTISVSAQMFRDHREVRISPRGTPLPCNWRLPARLACL